MEDSANEWIQYLVWLVSRDSNGFTMYLPRGCLTIYLVHM